MEGENEMDRLAVVNLNDLYLTRTDANKAFRKVYRTCGRGTGSSCCFAASLGILYVLVYDLMKHVDALEDRVKTNETAG
jgi:hypothetical protein